MKSRLQPLAVDLRQRQTDAELKLWFAVRDRRLQGAKFRRQVPIGPYIVDFICKEANLIVELDGGQHSPEVDQLRDTWLKSQGFRLLRFWNNDVMLNLDGILQTIASAVEPSPASGGLQILEPSPACGRGQGEGGDA